jgi:acetate kinase
VKAILILNAGSSSLKFALFPMTPRLADLPRCRARSKASAPSR